MKHLLKNTPTNEDVEKQTTALVHYGAMCREIAACARIDEVKDIRDKAMALAVYARQALNRDAETQAAQIRMRAEKRAGSLLKDMREKGERDSGGRGKRIESERTTQLSDLGVTKDQSSQWQQLADIPEDEFEAFLADSSQIPTTEGLLNQHKAKPDAGPKVDPLGLWLWGRLCDFERDGILELDAAKVYYGLPHTMQKDLARLAPQVSKWLKEIPTR